MEWAKNKPCHGEEHSDVAIQLEIQMHCRARQSELAMTNHFVIARCAKRAVAIQLLELARGLESVDRASLLVMTDSATTW